MVMPVDAETISEAFNKFNIVISVLGLIGNALIFVTLTRPQLRKSNFSFYLIVLNTYDFAYLLISTVVQIMAIGLKMNPSLRYIEWVFLISVITNAARKIAQSGSFYTTIALNIDRCYAVLRPLQWKGVFTRFRMKIALAAILLWSVIYTLLPVLYIKEFKEVKHFGKTFIIVKNNKFGNSSLYRDIYGKYMIPTTNMIIPVICIFVCNSIIIHKVKCSRKNIIDNSSSRTRTNETNKLTAQVISISLLTLFTRVLEATSYIMASDVFSLNEYHLALYWVSIFHSIFLRVNSACNFIFYFIFGTQFRKVFLTMFKCCEKRQRQNEGNINGTLSSNVFVTSRWRQQRQNPCVTQYSSVDETAM